MLGHSQPSSYSDILDNERTLQTWTGCTEATLLFPSTLSLPTYKVLLYRHLILQLILNCLPVKQAVLWSNASDVVCFHNALFSFHFYQVWRNGIVLIWVLQRLNQPSIKYWQIKEHRIVIRKLECSSQITLWFVLTEVKLNPVSVETSNKKACQTWPQPEG